MINMNELNDLKPKIIKILKKNKVARAGIFGSYARGDQNKKSDIDILIEVNGKKFSLLDLIALEMELQEKLGIKVDLLTYNSLNPLLKKRVLDEEIKII